MRNLLVIAGLAAGVLGAAAPSAAQGALPLSVEVRGGAAFPTGDISDRFGAETGVSYGVNAALQATSLIGIYAGYERAELGVDDVFFSDATLTDEGFAFGGRLTLPFGGLTGLTPWIRAGAVYNQFTLDTGATGSDLDSDRAFGFEIGGGLAIPLGMVVSVTPGVRYRAYSPEFSTGGTDDLDFSYFVADLGLSFGF